LLIKKAATGTADERSVATKFICVTIVGIIIFIFSRFNCMKKLFFVTATLLLLFINGFSQNPYEIGAEYIRTTGQMHSGARAAGRYESFSNKNSLSIGLTYQIPSKKSYSVAHGYGLYIGYRYSFSNNIKGNTPFAGARVLFSLENFEGQTSKNSLFITPWAEAGYHFVFAKHIYAAPCIAFGKELKLSKDFHSLDEDNGGRFMPSLSAGYRFGIK
jgi:hypothetical protein